MTSSFRCLLWCSAWTLVACVTSAEAAGRVRLELFTDEQAPLTSQQQWLRELAGVGITGLRIRTGQPTDKVGIDVQGNPSDPLYVVTGMITSSNELIVPGGRFRIADAPQVARWLEELARKGLKHEEPTVAFGLTAEQYERVQKDLAQPVGFSTQGIDRWQVLRKMGQRLSFPLRIPEAPPEAADGDKIAEELSGLSCGTALACLLRPAGLGLVPCPGGRDGVEYRVLVPKRGMNIWPVGWSPQEPLPKILPALYQSFNANIQDVSVTTVLKAVARRLKIPYLLDHNALTRHGIEPDKKKVNSPQSRTTYKQLLRRILSQGGLKGEIRLDEAGKPFLWVTSSRPM